MKHLELILKNRTAKISGLKFTIFEHVTTRNKPYPRYSGVYALVVRNKIDDSHEVKYIGCAVNIRTRLSRHFQLYVIRERLLDNQSIEIWTFEAHIERKNAFEKYLINKYTPPLNKNRYLWIGRFINLNKIKKDNKKLLAA